ncbi:MAG TPA: 2Fe-2S iron-sulfur cluster-binding protein [Vicinamibacterales bacterium]|nr:2Fe-2S iron-sulfur cluster-binding protein [Vicinamibacterales bacterium]
MSLLTINGHDVDARPGENVIDVARRHGLHIWFLCDGRGLCRTCECRVLSGGDQLSPPSRSECESLSKGRRAEGFRLACQATIEGTGRVDIISTAEHLRRLGAALDLRELLSELTRFSLDFSSNLPGSAMKVVPRLLSMPPSPRGVQRYVRDGLRMIARLF